MLSMIKIIYVKNFLSLRCYTLEVTNNMVIDQNSRLIVCEKCKNEFYCNANSNNTCGCVSLEIKVIDKSLKDCICNHCLCFHENKN